jgi:hypothetical protein
VDGVQVDLALVVAVQAHRSFNPQPGIVLVTIRRREPIHRIGPATRLADVDPPRLAERRPRRDRERRVTSPFGFLLVRDRCSRRSASRLR